MSVQEQGPSASSAASSASNAKSGGSSSSSSRSSLVKLDEISSFGATKRARLPALIKLTEGPLADLNSREASKQQAAAAAAAAGSNSMPHFSESQLDKMASAQQQQHEQQSLPAGVPIASDGSGGGADKENALETGPASAGANDISVDGFQVVEMDEQAGARDLAQPGPSLPAATATAATLAGGDQQASLVQDSISAQLLSTNLNGADYASHLGDSLIEMIINLRNENQNLVRALETNNDYVKERLSEFKRVQEEAKRREQQHAAEKAEHEHQARKLQRQNAVLSERLKSMEAKLKDMKLEVSESLLAAHSSRASSLHENLYPELGADGASFSNPALGDASSEGAAAAAATTMQMDATEGELYNEGDARDTSARPMECGPSADAAASTGTGEPSQTAAQQVANMSREELSKRFDADKREFLALDDPMKQCDQLERQLNGMGKRDYEICLLQQQLNIYRQDFRLERMAKLEAKIQIEKLKNEIDRLCLERALLEHSPSSTTGHDEQQQPQRQQDDARARHFGPTPATAAADGLIGKLGHQLGRKAIRSAAKAARYAAKQAHLEEKTAAALARAAAAKAAAASHLHAATNSTAPKSAHEPQPPAAGEQHSPPPHHHRHPHHHHHHHRREHHREHLPHHQRPRTERTRGVGSEIVSDLINLGNKTMLTGYKMASTHVNLALDKLSQYEQQQAAQLAAANAAAGASAGAPSTERARQPAASAPPPDEPSMD